VFKAIASSDKCVQFFVVREFVHALSQDSNPATSFRVLERVQLQVRIAAMDFCRFVAGQFPDLLAGGRCLVTGGCFFDPVSFDSASIASTSGMASTALRLVSMSMWV